MTAPKAPPVSAAHTCLFTLTPAPLPHCCARPSSSLRWEAGLRAQHHRRRHQAGRLPPCDPARPLAAYRAVWYPETADGMTAGAHTPLPTTTLDPMGPLRAGLPPLTRMAETHRIFGRCRLPPVALFISMCRTVLDLACRIVRALAGIQLLTSSLVARGPPYISPVFTSFHRFFTGFSPVSPVLDAPP